jgi:phosphoribosylformimino-5-aminoimidazole carboxamide ribotide isomerase
MIIFPAIDLKDGCCVRLIKGEMAQATVFNDSPKNQAQTFQSQGFEWIHIVDLNGAFEGKPVNRSAVEEIVAAVDIPVQLGGGIRDLATIESWLKAGVSRVILGTVALRNPEFVKEACKRFPQKIVVGIDGRQGMVAVEGWAKTSTVSVIALAKKFQDAGVAAIIYTDIERDGVLSGPDVKGTKILAEAVDIPVIASGGVASNDDLAKIKTLEPFGVVGVITGRALYDGHIDIPSALEMAKSDA